MSCFQIGAIINQIIMAQYATNSEEKYLNTCVLWPYIIVFILGNLLTSTKLIVHNETPNDY